MNLKHYKMIKYRIRNQDGINPPMPVFISSTSQKYIYKDTPLNRKRALINMILSGFVCFILLLRICEVVLFSSFLFVVLSAFILSIQILNFTLFRRKLIPGPERSSRRNPLAIHRIIGYTSPIYLAEWILVILSYLSVMYLLLDSLDFGMEYSGAMYVVLAIIGVLLFLPILDVIFTKTDQK